jgi:uncharacterized OsmC-like protein
MAVAKINIREVQGPLKQKYREEPDSGLIVLTVKSSESDLGDPLHCSISPEAAPDVVWQSGAHPGVGGLGDVPCSGDLLLGALAACQEVTIRMVAAAMGIELEALEVQASGRLDLRGTMGVSSDAAVGFQAIECRTRVRVKGDDRPDRAQRLLENAERYCVVLNTLREGVQVDSKFELEVSSNPASS